MNNNVFYRLGYLARKSNNTLNAVLDFYYARHPFDKQQSIEDAIVEGWQSADTELAVEVS